MRRIVALTLVVGLVAVLAASTTAGAQGNGRPGVTAKEIRVGGYASPPNDTLNVAYPDGFEGAEAYFEKVNKEGGVFGRKLKLIAKASDQGQASTGATTVRSLVEEKNVFAVLPVMTNSFVLGSKYLFENNVPAFGINVEPAWCGSTDEQAVVEQAEIAGDPTKQCPRTNLFGEKGSYLCFECPGIGPSFTASQKGLDKVAVFGYTHVSSSKCVEGLKKGFAEYGQEVVHENSALEFGFAVSELAADVQAMKDKGVQFVATCMEFGGGFKISQALKQAGVEDVVFYAPEGYKQSTLDKYGDQLNDWIFRLGFAPWQGKQLQPGTKEFLKAMKARDVEPSEHSQAGWINAALLVAGIEAAGPDFTRQSVIDAINGINDWTADGMLAGVDWTAAGTGASGGHGPTRKACDAYVEAVDGKFKPVFGKPGQPFVCFPDNPRPPTLDAPFYLPLKAGETDPTVTP
jgi:ABC-type branched-subunit amino acid transport system substrate-binding protein